MPYKYVVRVEIFVVANSTEEAESYVDINLNKVLKGNEWQYNEMCASEILEIDG